MIQGTTPTHIFRLPIDAAVIAEVRITYEQLGKTMIEKTEKDVQMTGYTITLGLSQEETLRLNHRALVRLQVKVLTTDGQVMASKIRNIQVDEILSTEVLA